MNVEVFDTLRDARQDPEVNMDLEQTIQYVQKVHEFFKDIIIELSYAQSDKAPRAKELYEKVKTACPKAIISTFGSTHNPKVAVEQCKNVKAMLESGAKIATIFGKTWIEQIEVLQDQENKRLTTVDYLTVIKNSVKYLLDNGIERVIYDAEHFFSGFKDDPDYTIKTLISALDAGADTYVFCDTKGLVRPMQLQRTLDKLFTYKINGKTLRKLYPDVIWGFHGHNDKGHAVSNSVTFVEKMKEIGAKSVQIQGTFNGTGERCGNADLIAIIAQIKEDLNIDLDFKEDGLTNIAHDIARVMTLPLDAKKPYVGTDAGAHKAGMHIFSIGKGSSYLHTNLSRWGNREYILFTSMAGKDFLQKYLDQYGIIVEKSDKRLDDMINKLELLERAGYKIHKEPSEQLLFVHNFFEEKIKMDLRKWETQTGIYSGVRTSQTTIYGAEDSIFPDVGFSDDSTEGPVDSQFQVLKKTLGGIYPYLNDVRLVDFKVAIAKPHGSKSSVLTYLTFVSNGYRYRTQGLSENILEATKNALIKGMQYCILRNEKYKQVV